MRYNAVIITLISGLMLLAPLNANATTFKTKDKSLTIETPDDSWKKKKNKNHSLVLTSEIGSIIIDQLKNGELLPNVKLADDEKKGVIQSYISTPNEVYVIKGKANKTEDLRKFIKIFGTIELPLYDKGTEAPAQKNAQTATTQAQTVVPQGNNKDATSENSNQAVNSVQESPSILDSFNVWYEDGSFAGTMVEDSNGKFYLDDNESQSFDYIGNGIYIGAQNTAVYAYQRNLGSISQNTSGEYVDVFPVWDVYGNLEGDMYQYSDGSFYLENDMEERFTYIGYGVYENVQMTLYAYNPASLMDDEDDYDYDNDYDY